MSAHSEKASAPRQYVNYSRETLKQCVSEVVNGALSSPDAHIKYGIRLRTIQDNVK